MINFRIEEPRDIPQIYRVIQLAFGQTGAANLENALRNTNALTLSMMAESDGEIIGHIVFSPVTIESSNPLGEAVHVLAGSFVVSHEEPSGNGRLLKALARPVHGTE